MKKFAVPAILVTLAVIGATVTRGAHEIGDKLQFAFKAMDGTDINIDNFKGKIVIIDFWATWCGPCMHEVPHMVAINEKFHDKGLQILGVSLDRAGAQQVLEKTLKEKNMTWPQWYEPAKVNAEVQAWGIKGIPHTVIVGPDGAILWRGHPAQIDPALADAFKNHPPQAADKKNDK